MALHFKVRTYVYLSFWFAATVVGLLAVFYARIISYVQGIYFLCFDMHPYWMSLATPAVFVAATFLVVRYAPEAKGSGIPQVLEAARLASLQEDVSSITRSGLVSIKTAVIKVLSSIVGILGGASIGREGPTVQIAASGFSWFGLYVKKRFDTSVDYSSYLIAGGAAGVAAAFNTPLAGITFALEEMADGAFGPLKRAVMLSVILAGIVSQALLGNYLYFGHPVTYVPGVLLLIREALLIGLAGGLAGALFARSLASRLLPLPGRWWLRALICGTVVSAVTFLTHGDTAGSGYEVTRRILGSPHPTINFALPLWKLATTVASQLSGMAGGIFSPSLSIGSGIGLSIAGLLGFVNVKTCALIGMVAFFSGAIQAPLTGVVIVMEMTDERALIIPFMIAAFHAEIISRQFMDMPLYKTLALQHRQG